MVGQNGWNRRFFYALQLQKATIEWESFFPTLGPSIYFLANGQQLRHSISAPRFTRALAPIHAITIAWKMVCHHCLRHLYTTSAAYFTGSTCVPVFGIVVFYFRRWCCLFEPLKSSSQTWLASPHLMCIDGFPANCLGISSVGLSSETSDNRPPKKNLMENKA